MKKRNGSKLSNILWSLFVYKDLISTIFNLLWKIPLLKLIISATGSKIRLYICFSSLFNIFEYTEIVFYVFVGLKVCNISFSEILLNLSVKVILIVLCIYLLADIFLDFDFHLSLIVYFYGLLISV